MLMILVRNLGSPSMRCSNPSILMLGFQAPIPSLPTPPCPTLLTSTLLRIQWSLWPDTSLEVPGWGEWSPLETFAQSLRNASQTLEIAPSGALLADEMIDFGFIAIDRNSTLTLDTFSKGKLLPQKLPAAARHYNTSANNLCRWANSPLHISVQLSHFKPPKIRHCFAPLTGACGAYLK